MDVCQTKKVTVNKQKAEVESRRGPSRAFWLCTLSSYFLKLFFPEAFIPLLIFKAINQRWCRFKCNTSLSKEPQLLMSCTYTPVLFQPTDHQEEEGGVTEEAPPPAGCSSERHAPSSAPSAERIQVCVCVAVFFVLMNLFIKSFVCVWQDVHRVWVELSFSPLQDPRGRRSHGQRCPTGQDPAETFTVFSLFHTYSVMCSYAGGDAIRHWPEVIAEHRREMFKVCFLPGLYGGPKLTKTQIYRNKSYKMTQSQCPSSNSGPSAHSAAQPSFTENTKACRASYGALFSALRRAHVTGLKVSGDACETVPIHLCLLIFHTTC